MKKYLLSLTTLALLLCEASFSGGGMAFATSSGSCGTNVTYTLSDAGVLTISGTGAMTDYNSSTAMPWNSDKASVTSIVISEGVTSVGKYAFYGCSNATSVQISSTVTSIGQNAFQNCSKLATVKFGTSTTYKCNIDTIQSGAFSSCTVVANVYCYGSTTTDAMLRWLKIGFNSTTSNPFYASTVETKYFYTNTTRQTSLTTSNLSGATKIKQFAFYNNTSLTAITLPTTITWIGKQAFGKCSNTGFTKLTIPKNVTVCGDDIVTGCSSLTSITWNAVNCSTYDGTNTYTSSINPLWNPTIKNQITTFKFGSDVEVIPAYLCYNLRNLAEINIPLKVTTIGASAFQNCTTAVALEIPVAVETIGANAFNGCTGLTKILARPTTQPTASANTFTGVTTTIPVTVTSAAALESYPSATGWSVFENYTATRSGSCGASANWELDYAAGTLAITGSGATTDYGSYSDVPWIKDTSFIYTASVANAITRLGHRAFYGCQRLTSVSTNNSQLASIGQYAFYNCKRLEGFGNNASQINIPKGVVTIENYAFQNCSTATKVYMFSNSELTTIGSDVFENMSSLTDVAIYNCANLTTIGGNAFKGCSSLANITLPASITSIGSSAFANCASLTPENGKVNFKGTVDQWANISYSIAAANPASLTQALYINNVLLTDCELSVNPGAYTFYNNKALESLTLNEGITTIGGNTFYGCSNISSVVFPSTLTTINNYAFQKCTSLTSVDFTKANNLATIGSSAFWEADITGNLYIPASVNNIGGSAFRDNSHISAIFATPTTAPSGLTSSYTFQNVTKSIPFYVLTAAAMTSYQANTYWNEFTNMKIGGCCGATGNETNVLWEYNPSTGLLTISGTGAMKDYANSSSNRSPWYSFASSVTSIKICDGVTHVGKFAFHTCSNATEVWMSTTVTECGASAFLGCSGLNNVKYGKTSTPTLSYATDWAQIDFGNYSANPLSFAHSLQVYKPTNTMPAWGTVIGFENRNINQIKKYAFYGCTSLTSATLPSNVETIEESAFYGCTNLATVTLPDALTTIGKEAFKNCSTLTSITIPENVTLMTCHNGSTTYSIFGGCAQLTTIVWNARNCASDYIKVGTGSGFNYGTPFSGIYSQITSITFGENVERIPNYLCYHMDHLTSVTIPASVTNIGTEAFDACSSTMSVTCEGTTPPTLASGAFSSPSTKKLYLPHDIDVKAAYRAASGWNSFTEANTFPKIVQFDLNGQTGEPIEEQYFDDLTSKASASSDPADVNYHSFSGWYQEAECENTFNFEGAITQDTILYAKWAIYNYQVTFDMQGHGEAIAAKTIDHNGLVNQPDAPSADYYTFGGWYKEAGCSNAWNFSEDHVTEATTLYAKWTLEDLTLNDNANNASVLELYNTETTTVHLTRTIISDSYNTICLPFAMSAAQVETYFGAECDIEELTRASYADGDLKLFFTKRTAIEAGKPYLIKPQADVANPTIADVTIDNTARPIVFEGVTFTGTFSPTVLANSEDLLFLGASNTLYMSSGGTMKGMRGYFQLTTPQAQAAARRSARIVFHEEVATGIETVESQESKVESTKIMRDGQLLIIRDGKTYNAQGALIK